MTGRRAALLDAADRVVRREGPQASMAAIAAEAGITKPVLYRHFGDKGGLYAALAERHTERLLAVLRAAMAAGGERRDRVGRAVDAYLASIAAEPEVYRLLLHSTAAAPAQGQVRSFLRRLSDLLAAEMAAELGQPVTSLRVQVWARGLVGLVREVGDWWLLGGGQDRSLVVAEVVDLLWGAYAVEVGAP